MIKKLAVLFVLVIPGCVLASVGDIWDAKADWSDTSNPNPVGAPRNGIWSYRDAVGGGLLLQKLDWAGGYPPGWDMDGAGSIPSLSDDQWPIPFYTGEFVGHGPWIVRWESPVEGYVKITGTMLQPFEVDRRMSCVLSHNGDIIDVVYVPEDAGGDTVLGRTGMTDIGPVYCQVGIDDTLAFSAVGASASHGGNGVSTFAITKFTIEQIDESEFPLPAALIDGDITRNGVVDFDDLVAMSEEWLQDDCALPRWCEGADIDESDEVTLQDFCYISENWLENINQLHNLGYVVISPDGPTDGSDFGKFTLGTQTAGFQEAIDYAVANNFDVYVFGGGMPDVFLPPAYYVANTAIYIPPAENLRITGGDYLLSFTHSNGDCIVFDSQKNSEFDLGCIVAGNIQNGSSIIKLKPQSPRPDGQIALSNSSFLVNFFVGGGDVWGEGIDGKGTALTLDGSAGAIENNTFLTMEINACEKGIVFEQGDIRNNTIESPFTHITNKSIEIYTGSYNTINAGISASGTAVPGVGANIIAGNENIFRLVFQGGFVTGQELIFGNDARDNLVFATALASNGVTNNATNPTNRIVYLQPKGFGVGTPAVPPSGADYVNNSSCSVVITIKIPGDVYRWVITDANGTSQTINAPLRTGQLIYMGPGEKIRFHYDGEEDGNPPAWKWRASL